MEGRQVLRKAEDAGSLAVRAGYVMRGVIYVVMGWLALVAAAGLGGTATDLQGSVVLVRTQPFGSFAVMALVCGLAAYSVWGLVRAAFDPLSKGDDPEGLARRLGYLSSAVSYGVLCIFGLRLLAGHGTGSPDSTQSFAAHVLSIPGGGIVTVGAGIASLVVGLAQLWDALTGKFLEDMKRGEMSPDEKRLDRLLGGFGMLSRGVTFLLIGFFLVRSGSTRDPSQAHGYSGVLMYLLGQPFGHLLLALVALGFVALGLHSFAGARWARVEKT